MTSIDVTPAQACALNTHNGDGDIVRWIDVQGQHFCHTYRSAFRRHDQETSSDHSTNNAGLFAERRHASFPPVVTPTFACRFAASLSSAALSAAARRPVHATLIPTRKRERAPLAYLWAWSASYSASLISSSTISSSLRTIFSCANTPF